MLAVEIKWMSASRTEQTNSVRDTLRQGAGIQAKLTCRYGAQRNSGQVERFVSLTLPFFN